MYIMQWTWRTCSSHDHHSFSSFLVSPLFSFVSKYSSSMLKPFNANLVYDFFLNVYIKVDPGKPAPLTWQRRLDTSETVLSQFTLTWQEILRMVSECCSFCPTSLLTIMSMPRHCDGIKAQVWSESLYKYLKYCAWNISKWSSGEKL